METTGGCPADERAGPTARYRTTGNRGRDPYPRGTRSAGSNRRTVRGFVGPAAPLPSPTPETPDAGTGWPPYRTVRSAAFAPRRRFRFRKSRGVGRSRFRRAAAPTSPKIVLPVADRFRHGHSPDSTDTEGARRSSIGATRRSLVTAEERRPTSGALPPSAKPSARPKHCESRRHRRRGRRIPRRRRETPCPPRPFAPRSPPC